jgi:hypothetical protein
LNVTGDVMTYSESGVIYTYDGLESGTVQALPIDSSITNVANVTAIGQKVFFSGYTTSGWRFYSFDMVSRATVSLFPSLVFSTYYNVGESSCCDFAHLTSHNGSAFFIADNNLYQSDGTVSGSKRLAFIGNPPYGWSGLLGIFAGDKLLFSSDLGDGLGVELRQYDLATQTLSSVSDIRAGGEGSFPNNFALLNNHVLFSADNGTAIDVWSNLVPTSAPAVMLPDPRQQSTISAIAPLSAVTGAGVTVNRFMHVNDPWFPVPQPVC